LPQEAELLVFATLHVVAEAILPLFLLDKRPWTGRDPPRPIKLHVGAVREDDRLARVKVGSPVSVPPKCVESSRRVHASEAVLATVPANFPPESVQDLVEDHRLHLAEVALSRDLLAIGVLDARKAGKCPEPCTHTGDDEV